MIWGFVYGAAAMAGTGLALAGLTGALSVTWWGIISGLIGLALVLAITLLWLLNTDRTPVEWRNKLHSNMLMAIIALTFLALCVNEVRKLVVGA